MDNSQANPGQSRGRGRGIKKVSELSGIRAPKLGKLNEELQSATSTTPEVTQQAPILISKVHGPVGGADGDERRSARVQSMFSDVVPSRPTDLITKNGSSGRKIHVQANYFKVLKRPDWTIYQYHVDFAPDIDDSRLRRGLLSEHRKLLGGYIFDGRSLFCTTLFQEIKNSSNVLELHTKSRTGENFVIKIRRVGSVEKSDFQQLQVLNLVVRRAMEGLNLHMVMRKYFDPHAKVKLGRFQMEIWPGYVTSIRQHESDILLCADIINKVMRTDSLYNIFTKAIRESDDYQSAFKREVIGEVVLTDYNNKTYRISDVDFESSPMSTFKTKDGEITFLEYYRKRYNITIRDRKQPLLVSSPTEKNIRGGSDQLILLIPELARATGLTADMRSNFQLMKAMNEHVQLAPERRIERLRDFNNRLQHSKASIDMFNSWNIKLDTKMVEVPARVLQPEKIVFGNRRKYVCDSGADWTLEFRNNSMFSHVDIKRWYVITPNRNVLESQEFVKVCIRVAKGMNMYISEPKYEEIPDDRNSNYIKAIDNAFAKDPQIVMLVLKATNEEKYSCIKKRACVARPVPSQVVTLRRIAPRAERSSGLISIATKVVIQMNAKLMGAPWMIDLPVQGLMVAGFDVCHSSENRNKSFGALVATMDRKLSTRYFSSVIEHMKGQELSHQLSMNMTFALRAYRECHGALPERILFYRDGVGDGQLHQVVSTELKYLREELQKIYISAGKESCRMAYIVVSKRINARYFNNGRNPESGTVVDDVITLPERYDFFLVSQSIRQSTVCPTSYNIIYDNIGLNADKLQILTYKMTHMYYNCSNACRVPAVCQYAHKLAFLVAQSIHCAPSSGLQSQLYFL